MDSLTIIGTGYEIEEKDLVEFRLLFQGTLPSCGNSIEKHAIRRSFHPQLRHLWATNPNLRHLAARYYDGSGLQPAEQFPTPEEKFDLGIKAYGRNWNRAGYNIVPLVTPDMALRCSIDIILLRPEDNRYVLKHGDIDNKLKTIFDALRIPDSTAETGGAIPDADDDPLFVLLQDDALITEVKVTTDKLLMLPNERRVRSDDAYAVIHVKLNHKNARTFDNYFG